MSGVTFGRRFGDAIWFIIVERDTDSPFRSDGAILMEQYTKVDLDAVQERAQGFANSGRYGRVWMGSINERDCSEVLPKEAKP